MKGRFLLGILISGICLAAVFYRIDFPRLGQALATTDYRWLIPAGTLLILILIIRATRWGLLLSPVKKISFSSLFSATAIGFMANNLLPLRMGEMVRAWVLGRRTRVPVSTALATLVLARAFDLFSILSLLAILLIVDPPGGSHGGADVMRVAGGAAFASLAAALGCLVVLERRPDVVGKLADRFLPLVPRRWELFLRRATANFITGLAVLRSTGRLAVILLISFGLWGSYAVSVRFLLEGFHLDLPPMAPVTVLVAISLGVLLPSSPGFIGPFHAAAVSALAIYTVPRATALGFALLFHGLNFVPLVVIGLIFLWIEGLSLKQVSRSKEAVKE